MDLLNAVPDVSTSIFLALVGMSLFTAAMGASVGLGGGVLLIAVMAMLLPPAIVIPLHGVVQLAITGSRAIMLWRYVLRSFVPPFAAGAVVGAVIGGNIAVTLPPGYLQAILGLFVLIVCWLPKMKQRPFKRSHFAILGGAGSLVSMFVGATGTFLAPFIAASIPDRRNYIATFALQMSCMHVCRIVVFGLLGFSLTVYWPLIVAMMAAGLAGNWLGQHILFRMPEKLFRSIFKVVLTLLALRLLWVGVGNIAAF